MAGAALLLGCAPTQDPDTEMQRAKQAIAQRDYNSAGVRLKNVLAQAESAEARFLLGQALLAVGEPGLAAVEFDKALSGGVDRNNITPLLAQALLQSAQHRRLLEQFGDGAPAADASDVSVQLAVVQALGALGRPADMNAKLTDLERRFPENADLQLLRARVLADGGDLPAAVKLVNKVISADTKRNSGLRLLGDLQSFGLNDPAAARSTYQKALLVEPQDIETRARLTHLLLQQRDFEAADKQFAELKKLRPNSPQVRLISTLMLFFKGKHKEAGESIQALLQRAPDTPWLLELAGANALALGDLGPAEVSLNKALKLNPTSDQARGMLARTHIRAGDAVKALDVLAPLLRAPRPGAGVLSLAGEATLATGDAGRAKVYFEQAVAAQPDELAFRLGKAKALWAAGQSEIALAELAGLSGQGDGIEAEFLRVQYLLSAGRNSDAAEVAQAMETKRPGAAYVANLRADIALRSRQTDQARAFFDTAAQRAPKYFPPVAGLAALDAEAGKVDAAYSRLTAFTEQNPKEVMAYIALAELYALDTKRAAEASQVFSKAVAADATDPRPVVAWIQHLLRRREFAKAKEVAQEAGSRFPRSPAVLDQQAQALFLNGDLQRALVALSQWASLQPNSPEPHMRLAELQMTRREFTAAVAAYARASAVARDPMPGAAGQVKAQLLAGNATAALALARGFEDKYPANPIAAVVLGDTYLMAKNTGAAVEAYGRALKKGADLSVREKLYAAQKSAGRQAEAMRSLQDWLAQRPQDIGVAFALGQVASARQDWPEAEGLFQLVLKHRADNPAALNNLAWALQKQGRPGAVDLARRATELAPTVAPFFDTLAQTLAASQQWPAAEQAQRKAVALAGPGLGAARYRLDLVRILSKSGKKAAAQDELQQVLAAAPAGSSDAAAAAALRKDLGGL